MPGRVFIIHHSPFAIHCSATNVAFIVPAGCRPSMPLMNNREAVPYPAWDILRLNLPGEWRYTHLTDQETGIIAGEGHMGNVR